MTKEKYLEDLYQALQKYEADSTLKHVTEYDYLISDMLEESTIDQVIEKLGSSSDLAQSIAEEFGYELKKTNQFEEAILNRKQQYSKRNTYETLGKIIDVIFVIASVIFLFGYIISALGLLAFIFILGFVGLSSIFWILALLSFTIFVFSIYMIIRSLKNLLVNRLMGLDTPSVSGVN